MKRSTIYVFSAFVALLWVIHPPKSVLDWVCAVTTTMICVFVLIDPGKVLK